MNKKDFSIGLVVGFIVSMCFSFFLMNYYIGQKVSLAKQEAEIQYKHLKGELEISFQAKMDSLKSYTSEKVSEKRTELFESASEKVKKYWNKTEEVPDSVLVE